MSKKKKILLGFGIIGIIVLIISAYLLIVFLPKYNKENEIKSFYNVIESFSDVNSNIDAFSESLEVFSDSDKEDPSKLFAKVKIEDLSKSLIKLDEQINYLTEIPKEVEFEVSNIDREIDAAIPILKSLNEVYTYLSEISAKANEFEKDTKSFIKRVGDFSAADLNETIIKFNEIRTDFRNVFEKFNLTLSEMKPDDRVLELHNLIKADFSEYYSKVDSYFGDIDYLLTLINRANNNIYSLTQPELQIVKNISEEFANLQIKAESLGEIETAFNTYDYSKLISAEDISTLEDAITEIQKDLKVLESFRREYF